MNCPAFLSKFIAIGVKYLSMARKKWEFPPYVDRCLRQRWRKMVNQGIATKQQAYTLGWMEFFIDALFMMGAIDFPSDESAILRVKAFAEAMVNTEYVRRDEGEPSYLFEDGEEVMFAVGGMLCGTPEKDVFSALLITTKRIFAFDSMKAPPGVQDVLRELDRLDPDHIATVMQAPLQDIISASLRRPNSRFPHGSFLLTFRMPDYLKRCGVQLLAAAERWETDEQQKKIWKEHQWDLAEQISYEIALHSEDTYRQLCKLSGVLKAAGKEEGFAVSVE